MRTRASIARHPIDPMPVGGLIGALPVAVPHFIDVLYYKRRVPPVKSTRRGQVVSRSAIDADKPVPRRHAQKDPPCRSCNAVTGYRRLASDVDPMRGHGYSQPIASANGRIEGEAQPATNIRATYRTIPLRQAPRRHPRGRQVVGITSTGSITARDDR